MFCSNCGNKLAVGDKFCGRCGNKTLQPEFLPEVQEGTQEEKGILKEKSKKSSIKRILIVLFVVAVLFGIGIFIWNNVQKSEQEESFSDEIEKEEIQAKRDKSYAFTGNFEAAKNNLGAMGFVLKDEEGMLGDIDGDGVNETILFYIDGKKAYIEWNNEVVYEYFCNALCDDYLIVLPVGNDMAGFIFTKRNESKDAYFSKMICFYKGKCNSEYEFSLEGSVADGGLIVENDYAVHYDWETSSEHIFYNGKIYDKHSW